MRFLQRLLPAADVQDGRPAVVEDPLVGVLHAGRDGRGRESLAPDPDTDPGQQQVQRTPPVGAEGGWGVLVEPGEGGLSREKAEQDERRSVRCEP
jgi:hypothetical protein